MAKDQEEWFRQADYDIETAETLLNGGRYIYAVFMCHLCIEKALKGHYYKKFKKQAPKTHNLIFFIEAANLEIPKELSKFIVALNRENIVTRYPEDIRRMSKDYDEKTSGEMIAKSKEALEWLREKL